jgi:hypothetical protein
MFAGLIKLRSSLLCPQLINLPSQDRKKLNLSAIQCHAVPVRREPATGCKHKTTTRALFFGELKWQKRNLSGQNRT